MTVTRKFLYECVTPVEYGKYATQHNTVRHTYNVYFNLFTYLTYHRLKEMMSV